MKPYLKKNYLNFDEMRPNISGNDKGQEQLDLSLYHPHTPPPETNNYK
jgi:hypothetical protein